MSLFTFYFGRRMSVCLHSTSVGECPSVYILLRSENVRLFAFYFGRRMSVCLHSTSVGECPSVCTERIDIIIYTVRGFYFILFV